MLIENDVRALAHINLLERTGAVSEDDSQRMVEIVLATARERARKARR